MSKGSGSTRAKGPTTAVAVSVAPQADNNTFEGFLRSYRPQSRIFTSPEEISLVTRKLKLEGMSDTEITDTRNRVVDFYDNEMERVREAEGRSDKWAELNNAMMSVTAVIDDYRWRKGMRV